MKINPLDAYGIAHDLRKSEPKPRIPVFYISFTQYSRKFIYDFFSREEAAQFMECLKHDPTIKDIKQDLLLRPINYQLK